MTTVDTLDAGQYCQSCTAVVIWAQSERGVPMLVDADPVAGGNLRLSARGVRPPLAVVVAEKLRFGRTDLRMPHFATCPNANAHRRRKRAHS